MTTYYVFALIEPISKLALLVSKLKIEKKIFPKSVFVGSILLNYPKKKTKIKKFPNKTRSTLFLNLIYDKSWW